MYVLVGKLDLLLEVVSQDKSNAGNTEDTDHDLTTDGQLLLGTAFRTFDFL